MTLKTKNNDIIFVEKMNDGKIKIMINDGDGTGVLSVKEAKELIEIIKKTIVE